MKYKRILVTGGSGLVGNSLKKIIPNAFFVSSSDYDLTDILSVERMFNKIEPDCVIHLASKVPSASQYFKNPLFFLYENTIINSNVLNVSLKKNIERFITLLSASMYSEENVNFPVKETDMYLHTPSNLGMTYGLSKRIMASQIDNIKLNFNEKYQYLIPCNLYGNSIKCNENSHFIDSILCKINKTKDNETITLFGDGTPVRQYMSCDDLSKIIIECLNSDIFENFNVSPDDNHTIKDIVDIALKVTKNENKKIFFDVTKPNGPKRKDICNKKFKSLFPNYNFISLEKGIKKLYENNFS